MNCSDAQKVRFGTHMLEKEVENWWGNTSQRFEEEETEVTWALFREEFMEKYFLEDVCGKKEIEFLELKQGNSNVAEQLQDLKGWLSYIFITTLLMLRDPKNLGL